MESTGTSPLTHFIHNDRVVRHGIREESIQAMVEGIRLFRIADISEQCIVVREEKDESLAPKSTAACCAPTETCLLGVLVCDTD